MGSAEFTDYLRSLLEIGDRQVRFDPASRFAPAHRRFEDLYVHFVNLPEGLGGAGGAEAENNRMMFIVHGFGGESPSAPPPSGKVKVKMSVSALHRAACIREDGRTGAGSRVHR